MTTKTSTRTQARKTTKRTSAGRGTVKFINLPAQHKPLNRALLQAISRVIQSSHFILGPETAALEREIAELCGARFAVGCNSGTDALMLALKALNIGPGDEVIVPDFTFVATASAVLMVGATPVLADIEPETFNIDTKQAASLVTRRTKAIIPVHLYGQAADMDALLKLAKARKLHIIEDACQALGAAWRGRPIGALGEMGCISFFPTKNLGALGDAGMIVTNNEGMAERLRRLRQHGAARKYLHDELGYNSRLDDIQSAALRVKLPYLKRWNSQRQALARLYEAGLKNSRVKTPFLVPLNTHVYHQYAIRSSRRDALQAFLLSRGIETSVHYPVPLHQQPLLAGNPSLKRKYPNSSQAAKEVLCLPITPERGSKDIQRVIAAIREFDDSEGV